MILQVWILIMVYETIPPPKKKKLVLQVGRMGDLQNSHPPSFGKILNNGDTPWGHFF